MSRHAARTPRADKPLPVQTDRAERNADRACRLAELLADIEDDQHRRSA